MKDETLVTPRGIRHGSAFLTPASVLRGLLALDSIARWALASPWALLQPMRIAQRVTASGVVEDAPHDTTRDVLRSDL